MEVAFANASEPRRRAWATSSAASTRAPTIGRPDPVRLAGEFLQKRLACILRTFKSRVELGHRRGPPGTRGKAIWEAPGFSTTQIARRKAARTCLRARLPTHFLLWFSARRVACRAMILKRGEFIASSALMPRRAHSFRNKRSAKAPSHFARRRRSSCDSISVIDATLPQPPTACVVPKPASLSPATRLSSTRSPLKEGAPTIVTMGSQYCDLRSRPLSQQNSK